MTGKIRELAAVIRNTPIHPQWFASFREERSLAATCENLTGTVLDVGCAEGLPRQHLPPDADYVGLDYYTTATEWYGTRPEVFGDARALPFADVSIDHALLLDVLEHIPEPNICLRELHRVLKPGGSLTIQVPFLYPVHDAPLDFHRWTRFGLQGAARKAGFEIQTETAIGHPLETAALNTNIAMSQSGYQLDSRQESARPVARITPVRRVREQRVSLDSRSLEPQRRPDALLVQVHLDQVLDAEYRSCHYIVS